MTAPEMEIPDFLRRKARPRRKWPKTKPHKWIMPKHSGPTLRQCREAKAEHERAVLAALRELGPATLGRISKRTGLPTNNISAALRRLIRQREVTKRSKRTYTQAEGLPKREPGSPSKRPLTPRQDKEHHHGN